MRDGLNATDIRRTAEHGLPLTIEQQRYVVQIAFGPLPPRRKRVKCPECDGKGVLQFAHLSPECPAKCTDGHVWSEVPDQYTVLARKCACGKDLPTRCAECEIGDSLL